MTYYESAKRHLNLDCDWRISDIHLPELIELIHEWVSFFIVLHALENNVNFLS